MSNSHEGKSDGTPDSDRRDFLAALAVSASAGLAGCGGDGDESTATPTGTTTADGTTTGQVTATPEPTVTVEDLEPVELAPFWTTGENYGIGTVADHGRSLAGEVDPANLSRVWFTLTEGALAEPRFPRIDLMNLRSLDFLVADGDGYVARTLNEDRRDDPGGTANRAGTDPVERSVVPVADDALVYAHEFAAADPDHDWTLRIEYVADPDRDAILAEVTFDGDDDLAVYAVMRPAVGGGVDGDSGTAVDGALATFQGAVGGAIVGPDGEGYPVTAALASADGFDWRLLAPAESDAGKALIRGGVRLDDYRSDATGAGVTDGETAKGNLVLAGALGGGRLETTLALGFVEATDPEAAVTVADDALAAGYDRARRAYRESWRSYLEDVTVPDSVADDDALLAQYRTAAMTLRAVEDKTFHGAGVASPCVPWGDAVVADEHTDYGYNFVWSRDLYHAFTALSAMGEVEAATAATEYLLTVQQDAGGFLPQNTFLDGRTRWGGEQLDNVAFPLVMVDQLARGHGVGFADASFGYGDVRAGANYVARSGPETEQERWEEEGGYSPSTIAAEVAGLTSAAAIAANRARAQTGERAERARREALRWQATADLWREGVREWCVTREGVDGHEPPYYFRVSGSRNPDDGDTRELANGGPTLDERAIIDAGFLELVRLGVHDADADLIRASLPVVDETIRVDLPEGPAFYRYNGDGYGEGVDGAPWPVATDTRGRLWPILTGERAEYELAAGTEEGPVAPDALLETMAEFANEGRMLPEQVWDREDPTAFGWERGAGTGSATPLSWAMAGFVRLAHGLDAGEPIETPAATRERYADLPVPPSLSVSIPEGPVETETIEVTGTTDAEEVLVHTDAGEAVAGGGDFAVEVAVAPGRNTVTVVAADSADDIAARPLAAERTSLSRSS